MASELDVELEPYEVVGDLNFSTPVGSRTASPYQRSSLTFQEPAQQVETISPCAIYITYPWPDLVDSHARIPQLSWIPSSCHKHNPLAEVIIITNGATSLAKLVKLTVTNWLFSSRMMSPTTMLCHFSSTSSPSRNTFDDLLFTFLSLLCRCCDNENTTAFSVKALQAQHILAEVTISVMSIYRLR